MIALLASLIAMSSMPACSGADLAITKVVPKRTATNGLATYTLSITVTNIGKVAERGNALASASEVLDGEKKGEKGLPPLAAGAAYTFSYVVVRAAESPAGTTAVDLSIDPLEKCTPANDTFHISI